MEVQVFGSGLRRIATGCTRRQARSRNGSVDKLGTVQRIGATIEFGAKTPLMNVYMKTLEPIIIASLGTWQHVHHFTYTQFGGSAAPDHYVRCIESLAGAVLPDAFGFLILRHTSAALSAGFARARL